MRFVPPEERGEDTYQAAIIARRKRRDKAELVVWYDSPASVTRARVAAEQAKEAMFVPPFMTPERKAAYAAIETHYRANWERFVRAWTKRLAFKYGDGARRAAEEYIQSGYVNALESWDSPEVFENWVNTVISNAAKKQVMADNAHLGSHGELDDSIPDGRDNEENIAKRAELAGVEQALLKESDRDSEILSMYYFEQWTHGEIAGRFDLSESAVRVMSHRFKQKNGFTE